MKIETSNVQLSSRHKSEVSASISESLTVSFGQNSAGSRSRSMADAVRLSAAQAAHANNARSTTETGDALLQISDEDELKIKLIEHFVRQLTGKDFRIAVPGRVVKENGGGTQANTPAAPQGRPGAGFGMIYTRTVATAQSEQTAFQATAYIKTADGREISAQISLQLLRSAVSAENTVIRLGTAQAVDPLVVNFGAASASATLYKMTFDLDADGKTEQISFVGPGSGMLALDRNRDGAINDGSELFGPLSGNGFSDLASYDGDNNLWIDENDTIYDRLQIWVKDDDGTDRLFALAAKGIGAIYLGNVETPFSLENAGELSATIRRTGVFLREDGTAGTIQHVDMVV